MLSKTLFRQTSSPVALCQKKLPCNKIVLKPLSVRLSASLHDVETYSHYIGKGITLFTMFYCTLNWMYYKKINQSFDDEKEEHNKKEKK